MGIVRVAMKQDISSPSILLSLIDFLNDHAWVASSLRTLLLFAIPIALYALLFVVRTRKFPSLSRAKRRYQILKSYFPLPGQLVVKKAFVRRFTHTPSWIVFQRDPYYNKLITMEGLRNDNMDEFFDATFALEKQKFDNRVLVFEDSDFGILTSLISFFWPVNKVFEMVGPDEIRLMGIDLFDLDNDDSQEMIIYWLTYSGGSGGTFYPVVVKFNDDDNNTYTYFPMLKPVTDVNRIEEIKPREFYLKVNGTPKHFFISQIHTDDFWFFEKDAKENKHKLLFAYAQPDADYHYGPRSWYVISYKFHGGVFIIDSDTFPPFLFQKGKGKEISIKEMHGYERVLPTGQLFPLWSRAWKTLDTNDQPLNDMRKNSALFDVLELVKTDQRAKQKSHD